MIRSMTGFARREHQFAWGQLSWELRTVNHRYLEVSLRLPEDFRAAEAPFRQQIAAAVRRGKIECSLHFRATAASPSLEVDKGLLGSVIQAAQQIADRAGGSAHIDVIELLRWPGVLRENLRDVTAMLAEAQTLLDAALTDLTKFRDSEGARLHEGLEQRCTALIALASQVEVRLPEVRQRMRAKLSERIAQLVTEINQDRLEQELAMLAQRLDVDEEIDRLRGHVAEIRKTFAAGEPAGRRLDFLMQELNREANTLSSKSQDIETTRAAVDMKVLIEQMREQVQNIE
jgi:uncharacterized protein (TIGR00255 family)